MASQGRGVESELNAATTALIARRGDPEVPRSTDGADAASPVIAAS
jgi:hypothetical protein